MYGCVHGYAWCQELSPGDIMGVEDAEHQELEMGIPVFKNDTNDGS